jgi:hypothetical protein
MEDFMKKFRLLSAVLLVMLMASCASTQRTIPSLPSNVTAKSNESEVVVQFAVPRHQAAPLLNVLIDGEMVAQVNPNGTHSIMVRLAETAERERYRKQ